MEVCWTVFPSKAVLTGLELVLLNTFCFGKVQQNLYVLVARAYLAITKGVTVQQLEIGTHGSYRYTLSVLYQDLATKDSYGLGLSCDTP